MWKSYESRLKDFWGDLKRANFIAQSSPPTIIPSYWKEFISEKNLIRQYGKYP